MSGISEYGGKLLQNALSGAYRWGYAWADAGIECMNPKSQKVRAERQVMLDTRTALESYIADLERRAGVGNE